MLQLSVGVRSSNKGSTASLPSALCILYVGVLYMSIWVSFSDTSVVLVDLESQA